jgi:hypothetical protein
MDPNPPPNRKRRLVLVLSGGTDALIGSLILLFGFGVFPLDPFTLAIPAWIVILLGGGMFLGGLAVAGYNYSRLDE